MIIFASPLNAVRETMRKSILMDILYALIRMRDQTESPEVDEYIVRAMTGSVLDAKSKKQLTMLLKGDGK